MFFIYEIEVLPKNRTVVIYIQSDEEDTHAQAKKIPPGFQGRSAPGCFFQ